MREEPTRRVVQTGGGAVKGGGTIDVTFSAQTTNTAGAVASTLKLPAGVTPSADKSSQQAKDLTASRAVTFRANAGSSYEFVKYVGIDTALTSSAP